MITLLDFISLKFNQIKDDLKLTLNDSTGVFDYVLVDKDEHIKGYLK